MSKRSINKLERAIKMVEKAGLQRKLNLQLQMAQKILEHLRKIEKLRHAIMNLDQKTIAEIKSYSNPPEIVHRVMTGTFILLGEKEKTLKVGALVVTLILVCGSVLLYFVHTYYHILTHRIGGSV